MGTSHTKRAGEQSGRCLNALDKGTRRFSQPIQWTKIAEIRRITKYHCTIMLVTSEINGGVTEIVASVTPKAKITYRYSIGNFDKRVRRTGTVRHDAVASFPSNGAQAQTLTRQRQHALGPLP